MRLFKKYNQNPKLLASLKKVTFRSKYYKYEIALLFSLNISCNYKHSLVGLYHKNH